MNVERTIEQIKTAIIDRESEFSPYITSLVFAEYKNISPLTRINFSFPITALVGANGTNKSSILRALYGSVQGTSLGEIWFNTAVDSVNNPSYFYKYNIYNDDKNLVVTPEVRLTKVPRRGKPDEWETSRPNISYGMTPFKQFPEEVRELSGNATRWEKVKKEVIYLTFRDTVSAFDKFWYYGNSHKSWNDLAKRKKIIRKRSNGLFRAISEQKKSLTYDGKERILNRMSKALSAQLVTKISDILGSTYDEIYVIQHLFFNTPGFTFKLKKSGVDYTEAFAGSGEFAVINLVLKLSEIPKNSLILLDEPEVSLHPRAQKKLMEYLFSEVLSKKHQIVIATHSSNIIKYLPPDAIKVFRENSLQKVELVSQYSSADEAFLELGEDLIDIKYIYVEDKAAQAIIERVIYLSPELNSDLFKIIYFGGGAEQLYKVVGCSASVEKNNNKFIFFDGDQDTGIAFPDYNSLTIDQSENLDTVIEASTGIKTNKILPLDSNKRSQNSIEMMRNFLQWCTTQIHFLPEQTPELLILKGLNHDISTMSGDDAKQYFLVEQEKMRQQFSFPDSTDIAHIYKAQQLLNIDLEYENFKTIERLLISIIR
ncbi:AAA family ATPase [Acinetobacter pittii]|uniref:ATP-dependent nuclease n=1 Tax=Acinetobacter TaxID=469 RepID=UPI0019002C81|nr:ATP-binding protein [Acinetobacter oleivorans]MBJ8496447.1 AAA family ATPase [Acinetobacter oleivorans]